MAELKKPDYTPRKGGERLVTQTPAPRNAPFLDRSESITLLKIDPRYFCLSKYGAHMCCSFTGVCSITGGVITALITVKTDRCRPSTTGRRFSIGRPLASHRAVSASS